MDREDTAVRMALGYPEVQVVYHMPWDTDLEFGLGAGFFYGLNAQTPMGMTGGMALAEGRWRFFKENEHSLSLVAMPTLMMGSGRDSDFAVGLTIDFPGIVYDYEIKGDNHAILGIHIPWGLFVGEVNDNAEFSARIPFVFKMGMEFALNPQLHIFVTSELGVDVWTGKPPISGGSGAYLYARGLAGAGLLL